MIPYLTGQTAFVTGASKGLGRATAQLLARAGANVVAFARDQTELDSLVSEIRSEGGHALAVSGDLGEDAAIAEAVKQALDAFGRVDLLLQIGGSTAGIGAKMWETSPDDWAGIWSVNANGPLNLIRHIAPVMKRNNAGRMLFISSPATMTPTVGTGAYAACKAAVNQMVQTLSLELRAHRVAVNAFSPGPIDTGSWAEVAPVLQPPGGQPVKPQDPMTAARLPLWLCAPETAHLTGEFIHWANPETSQALKQFAAQYQLG